MTAQTLRERRVFVGLALRLGEDDVDADHRGAATLDQRACELAHPAAVPGPAPHPRDARFVDIDNDDPVVGGR